MHNAAQALLDSAPIATRAEPYTVTEIDAHPDSERIWATIIGIARLVEEADDALMTTLEEWREAEKEWGE